MLIFENDFPFTENYPLERIGKREQLLFFDIETTGFSGDLNRVYLIGAVYFKENCAHYIQWFADTVKAETEIIESFFRLMSSFRVLVHFNGDTFDIPFLLKRCRALKLQYNFDHIESFDILKQIRPYKGRLGLDNMKQKTIEAFLKIEREDKYNGGQLIAQEHGDDGGRRFVRAETVIVAGVGGAHAQKARVLIHRLHHRG